MIHSRTPALPRIRGVEGGSCNASDRDPHQVDETLFSGNRSRQGRPRSDVGASYVSKEQMANLLGSDSVVMNSAELSRLKAPIPRHSVDAAHP